MKILFISHKYPPTIGGMETQSYELITQAEKDHTVLKLVHTGEDESKVTFFWKLKSRVKKLLLQHPDINVIHLNDGLMGMFTLWLKKYTSIPVVITFHGLDLVFPNQQYQNVIKNKMTNYDAAICVSTATANECIKRNFPKEKVFTIPNGVNHQIAQFKPNPSAFKAWFQETYKVDLNQKKIIMTLGRSVQRKGFSWFLQHIIPTLEEDTLFIMVGPIAKTPKKSLWQRLIPNGLQKQIELASGGLNDEAQISEFLKKPFYKNKVLQTGKLPYDKVQEMLSLADLFVMPNVKKWGDAEGFGLVALEASLCKTVVVASDLEGIPEAIQHQKNGILVPSAKIDKWRDTIHHLLADTNKLITLGEQYQQFTLNNYSWKKMTDAYCEVFEKVGK